MHRTKGYKRKNEKKIYEGDIVRYLDGENSFIAIVTWGEWYWFLNGIEPDDCFDFEDFAYHSTTEVEIIGNLYENPELL